MRIALPLVLGASLLACGAREPSPAPMPPAARTANEEPRPQVAPLATANVPAPAALAPAEEPSCTALALQELARWDQELAPELSKLDLTATGGADPGRCRLYLEHRFRQDLAAAALRRSKDPVLRALLAELERIPAFTDTPIAHVYLKMGPLEPLVCRGCQAGEPRCNQPRCDRELELLAPAVISAAGLGGNMSFGGHPVATSEGVETTPPSALAEYLDAVFTAGLSRVEMRSALAAIAHDLVRRDTILEGTRPLARDPGEPLARAVLRGAFERWRATYADRLQSPTLPALSADSLDGALLGAYVTSEAALYQPYRWARITRLQRGRARFYEEQAALERALAAGKEVTWESTEPPLDEEACLSGPPLASRRCAETEAARALFLGFLDGVSELESKPQNADQVAITLALALEHLTFAGLTPERVTEFYVKWLTRAAATR